MLKFNNWKRPVNVTTDNFLLPFFVFGIFINLVLLITSISYDYDIRQNLVYLFLAYSFLFSALHSYIFRKGIFRFLFITGLTFLVGLATFAFTFISLNTGIKWVGFYLILCISIYTFFMTLLLIQQFMVWPSSRYLVEIAVTASASISLPYLFDGQYLVNTLLFFWYMGASYIVLTHHSSYKDKEEEF